MPPTVADPPPVRLLDRLRAQIRCLHYSIRTEEAYAHEEHPLSRTLFEWSPSGWTPLP